MGPEVPTIYLAGSTPLLSTPAFRFGLATACALLLLVYLAQRLLVPRTRFVRTARVCLVVFFFAALECAMNLFVVRYPYRIYEPDADLGWRLNPLLPGLKQQYGLTTHDGAPVALSEWEHGMARQGKTYRILFFGDSQTINVANTLGLRHAYPKVVQRVLRLAFPDLGVEALNMGVSGYTSWQGLRLLKRVGLGYRPDLVVFAFGNHDAGPCDMSDSERMVDDPAVARLREILDQSQIYLMLHKVLHEIRPARPPARLDTFRVPLSQFESNLREAARLGREHRFKIAFLVEPALPDSLAPLRYPEYCEAMQRVAQEEHAMLLNVREAFGRLPAQRRASLFVDWIHLSLDGHRVVGRLLAEWLRDVAAEAASSGVAK